MHGVLTLNHQIGAREVSANDAGNVKFRKNQSSFCWDSVGMMSDMSHLLDDMAGLWKYTCVGKIVALSMISWYVPSATKSA